MVRAELINLVANRTGLTKKKTQISVNTVFGSIAEALAKGDKVELRGFGSFTVHTRNSRTGRNPKTGETVHVPASTQKKCLT